MRRRGTPEGRRLFAACAGTGAFVGVAAGIGIALAYRANHDVVFCNPGDPRDLSTCEQLDVVGFHLTSSTNAALTIGPVVGFLVFLLSIFVVLSSHTHHAPRD